MNVDKAEAHRILLKVVVGAALSLPVLVIAMSHGRIAAFNTAWINWVQLALTTPVVFWCGWQFFRSAWKGLRHFSANMDTLVAMGTGAAYVTRWRRRSGPGSSHAGGHATGMAGVSTVSVYYEAAAVIIVLILLGKYFERVQQGGRWGRSDG